MSWKHDKYDWIGGYPFEFSSYDVLEKYLQLCGFDLVSGKVGNSAACHEMIFKKKGHKNVWHCWFCSAKQLLCLRGI